LALRLYANEIKAKQVVIFQSTQGITNTHRETSAKVGRLKVIKEFPTQSLTGH
jgi:hypothetical protein